MPKTRPAVNAGVDRKPRRTAAQMVQVRADETTAKAQAKLEQEKAKRRLAALEDKQQKEDVAYAETANHPADRPDPASTPAPKAAAGGTGGEDGDDSGSGADSEPYEQPSDTENSEESDPELDDSAEEEPAKKKRKKKLPALTRADIDSSRKTTDGSGTPVMPAGDNKKRKAAKDKDANKPLKKSKTVPKKKTGLIKSKSTGPSVPSADDDSMVTPGGPALDNDTKEHVERPKTGKNKKGAPTAPLIVIKSAPPKAPTRKALRGGSAKWNRGHLPDDTAAEFNDEVVPLAYELVGTLPPWARMTVKHVQGLVDRVYGEGEHVVTNDGPWFGLVGYSLDSWRNGLGAQSHKAMESFIENYESDSEEEEPGADRGDGIENTAPPSPGSTPTATDTDAVATAAKPTKFKFNTPEGRAAFVKWALQQHEASGTMAFHWKTWGNGVDKKGFLLNNMILHAFAYHLACLEEIPGRYERREARPEGALLMSMQSVERELGFWKTGDYVNPVIQTPPPRPEEQDCPPCNQVPSIHPGVGRRPLGRAH
ncbi:hypothetical protein MVEN_00316600 [Mycena venus]|uniref:Uncharacterized protein n=1 Tax=Mycena venus TaxID=2733690 RepID=A0A8H7DA42_9AGAR|nr:hypothetical protein MVEN_00316600 [Mycena venus]